MKTAAVASPRFSEAFATLRRTLFVLGWLLLTALGTFLLINSFGAVQLNGWEYLMVFLFPLLFAQIAIGFVLALLGFIDWLRGGDPFNLMRGEWRKRETEISLAATAICVPVYNEDVSRVCRGIENMWRSLEATGQIEHFDVYILSDSNDADHWVEEECAWMYLCQRLAAFGKIFYRKRRHAINGKSGNVADFCRRWGKSYRYMIVLDADSIMSGPTLVRLVRAMEANPAVGILQTQPYMVLGQSLFRRLLQFTGRLYGGLFSQGCSFAQMSSGSYWGHNAIIRVAPFIAYCDLPVLPVPDPGKRHVLSHDTVEAALMRRAGYEVWLAYEEPGSYEEGPPNLSDMLKRDRRWCAGNLQHFWFLFARGIALGSRLQIWIGLMSYLSSPLWLFFLIAGSFGAYQRARFLAFSAGPEDVGATHPKDALILFGLTLVLLFTPRLLGLLTQLPRAKQFGGILALFISAVLELVVSVLLAPIFMIFHTGFVLLAISGWQLKWTTQNRSDHGLSVNHCLKLYGGLTLLGIIGQICAFYFLGASAFWMTPIFLGWFFAPALAWLTSSSELGQRLRRAGLFVIPEEIAPPVELRDLEEPGSESGVKSDPAWVQALLSPYVQSLHVSMVRLRSAPSEEPSSSLMQLRERLVHEGPQILNSREKLRLLWDAETVAWLHRELWSRPAATLHTSWQTLLVTYARHRLLSTYLLESIPKIA